MTKLVSLPLIDDLVDDLGNLTAGALVRNSDATYVNTSGALSYSRGTRTNYWTRSDPSDGTGLTLTNTTAGAYAWPATPSAGLTNAVSFAASAPADRAVYFSYSGTIGITYLFSAYVLMGNGSQPAISSVETTDYNFTIYIDGVAIPVATVPQFI